MYVLFAHWYDSPKASAVFYDEDFEYLENAVTMCYGSSKVDNEAPYTSELSDEYFTIEKVSEQWIKDNNVDPIPQHFYSTIGKSNVLLR